MPRRMGRLPYGAKRGLLEVLTRATFTAPTTCGAGVSLRLSAGEVDQLQGALRTLLSPLDCEHLVAWRMAALQTIAPLLGSDTSVSHLPLAQEPPFLSERIPALAEYATHYHTMDPNRDYRAIGTEAFIWPTMRSRCEQPTREAWLRSEFYNDWVRRQRLCQPCGLTVIRSPDDLPCIPFPHFSGVAGLWFYWDRDQPPHGGEREFAILRILLPAFEAGLHLVVRCAREREGLGHVLDALAEGVLLFDNPGHVVYENPAFRKLLADEPEAARIKLECAHTASRLLALVTQERSKTRTHESVGPGHREVRTTSSRYRIYGTLIGPAFEWLHPVAAIVLERATQAPLTATDLHDRYGLTAREVAVSFLLTQGRSNADLARSLGVSIHTARRHVERVLMKLGLHSRAAVGAKLREGAGRLSA